MLDRIPIVFISYSWTSKEYQESIVSLAERLVHDGIDVKLDIWDLHEGQDVDKYMEQCVTDDSIDKVLIVSNKVYTEKANRREGGTGKETAIISPEIYGKADQKKFIPVVMERDENGVGYLPTYLKSRYYRDLSGDNFEEEYEELIRTIYEEPTHRKPEIGSRPKWLTEALPDSLYSVKSVVKKLSLVDIGKTKDVSLHDFLDIYVESIKRFYDEDCNEEKFLKSFEDLKEYRNAFLDHLKTFSAIKNFGASMADEFERLYNTLFDIETFRPGLNSCNYDEFDLFRLHIWELFICTTAYLLHYELYSDINGLLRHTYFLRISPLGEDIRPFSYERLRFHSKMIEERIKRNIKGDLGRKYTLTGHYIVTGREYMPVYSAKAIAIADLFLYQVYNGLGLDELTEYRAWFPTLYVYADQYDSMWKKLTSKHFCEKIMPIFGVETIPELIKKISLCTPDSDCHYSGTWSRCASSILNWIKIEDVAKLP
ncbi:MAG: TIR domain-containing protein [Lachnospiraceae bacterium]|nr:TIR domain-containing protein [Lachnospiraceae bacterium]